MIFNEPTRPVNFVWTCHVRDFVTSAAWSPDGKRVAVGSTAGDVSIFEGRTGSPVHVWNDAHSDAVDAVAWSTDSSILVTAGRDGLVRWWSADSGIKTAEQHPGSLWVEFAAWSPQPVGDLGSLLAVGAGNRVTFWNQKGEPVGTPIKLPKAVADMTWVLGTSLAVATSTSVTLHNPITGNTERMFAAKDPVLKVSFSPNGKWLMTGTQDCAVHVWNCDSNLEMHMRGYAAKVRELAWHKGSRWLAAGGGESIAVWDCSGRGPEGRTPTVLDWHHDLVSALQYQPAGDWLASGAKDGGVAVWSPTQRQQLLTGAKISSGVTHVLWAPAEGTRRLLVTGEAGEVQLIALE